MFLKMFQLNFYMLYFLSFLWYRWDALWNTIQIKYCLINLFNCFINAEMNQTYTLACTSWNLYFVLAWARLSLLCMHVCERRYILWRTVGEGGRESKLKENFTSMATRLFRLPCLLSSSSILTEPGITSTALLSVQHRRASVRSLLLFFIQSRVVLVYVGLWMCWWVGGWVAVLVCSIAILGAFVVHIHC